MFFVSTGNARAHKKHYKSATPIFQMAQAGFEPATLGL
jgi:hypothetical protein